MREKWTEMSRFQKALLLLTAALTVLFLILYISSARVVGIRSGDSFFRRTTFQNGAVVYSGKRYGQEAAYTVWETAQDRYTVEVRYGEERFGPYTVEQIPVPEGEYGDWGRIADGWVEIREGERVLFRGGYQSFGDGQVMLLDEGGEPQIGVPVVSGAAGPVQSPSTYELVRFTVAAEVERRNEPGLLALGLLVAAVNTVSILFADELFCLGMSFRIRRPEDAEPSEWELFSRGLGWCVLLGLTLFCFVCSLGAH